MAKKRITIIEGDVFLARPARKPSSGKWSDFVCEECTGKVVAKYEVTQHGFFSTKSWAYWQCKNPKCGIWYVAQEEMEHENG